MNRCFVLLNEEKVIDITIGAYSDEQAAELFSQGYKEIECQEDINILTPYLYKNGKLIPDKNEIKRREDDRKVRAEYDECMMQLSSTDYVVIKIAEGVATEEEYADVLKDRAEWRERINALQKELNLE